MERPCPLVPPRSRRCEPHECGPDQPHVRFALKSMSERSARNEKRSAEVECSVRPYSPFYFLADQARERMCLAPPAPAFLGLFLKPATGNAIIRDLVLVIWWAFVIWLLVTGLKESKPTNSK